MPLPESMLPKASASGPSSPVPQPQQTPQPHDGRSTEVEPPIVALESRTPTYEPQVQAAFANFTRPEEAARAIFAALPTLPEEALEEATEKALEKLPDANFNAVVLPTLLNPATHGRVLSVIFADLMERQDAIALPALLAIARTPSHPFAESALDNLRLLLGQDPGMDWAKWEVLVKQRLEKANR